MTTFGTAYWGRDPRRARKDAAAMVDVGFSWVVVPVSTERMRFDFIGTARVMGALHDAGLGVWLSPWGVGGLFGGEGVQAIGGPRMLVHEWLWDAERLDPTGIYWDEPKGVHGPGILLEVRTGLPERIYWNLNVGITPEAPVMRRMQSIGVDCYDRGIPLAANYAKNLGEIHGRPTHVWVRAFGLDRAGTTCPAACIQRLAESGIDDIAVWGWPSPGCSILDCERPGKVWKGVINAIGAAR